MLRYKRKLSRSQRVRQYRRRLVTNSKWLNENPKLTLTQTDIEREIKNLHRIGEKAALKKKLKKKSEPRSSRLEKGMKFSEGQRRIRLQKADNEGFGFVIKVRYLL